ncbi:hypothetical protein GCM10020358_20310 [Amorphoplanes nipponensis]|uniref:Uncharacterized protein n=1 Tax=Actinoplanes nipponensis TaxID=135950 RepID=A0A919MUQ8_9ACTN|nr:hypothetical protein [Actinoplanes nipponensis]GIE50390.1 hypothetical protein Ani05nite_39240 [Actinoplanes nipponensis]
MTVPGYQYHPAAPPPAPERRRWRPWLTAVVAAWALALAGFAAWSVRHDPPTVPEQRTIAQALPVLARATGSLLAAADAGTRTVTLGELRFDRDCALTPVREGVEASREVSVRVRAGQAPVTLEEIARALPAGYAATARHNAAGTRYGLRADAGEFVGIEATADSDARVLSLRVSTGCRPLADGVDLAPTPRAATELPAALTAALRTLNGSPAGATSTEIACPGGARTARTVTSAEFPAPADLGPVLRGTVPGAVVVQADPHDWAYRTGDTSVVVVEGEGTARVSATTGCG